MLGDLDTDAVTGVSLSALTVSGMDSVIVPECRHLAVDFYLHALSFTLGIDPVRLSLYLLLSSPLCQLLTVRLSSQTTTASVEELPKVWGLGVPGFSAPEKATLSKGLSRQSC